MPTSREKKKGGGTQLTSGDRWKKPSDRLKLAQVMGSRPIIAASDDDPSGIAIYSQVGAQFGFWPDVRRWQRFRRSARASTVSPASALPAICAGTTRSGLSVSLLMLLLAKQKVEDEGSVRARV